MASKNIPLYSVAAVSHGYLVQRNALPLKTLAGLEIAPPNAALAEAIADEWRQQNHKIVPSTMPMTQLAMTALDITAKDREAVIVQLLGYVDSELLCHRAEHPEALAARQEALWQPLLAWCAAKFGVSLITGIGLMPVRQKPEIKLALRQIIEAYDDWSLTGLSYAVDCSGSLILGLALIERHLSVPQIVEAAELDARFQMEKWGEDSSILEHQDLVRQDLEAAQRWLNFLSKD